MDGTDRESRLVSSRWFYGAGRVYAVLLVGLIGATVAVGFVGQEPILSATPASIADPVRTVVGENLALALFVGVWQFLGLGAVVYGAVAFWKWVRIRGSDVRPIVDADPNVPVELEGVARPARTTVTAPLSGTECLAYSYEIEVYEPSDDGSNWETVDRGYRSLPFRLTDETGSIEVDPAGATFHVTPSSTTVLVETDDADVPAGVAELVDAADVNLGSTIDLGVGEIDLADERYRFSERFRIEPGEKIYVSGLTTADGFAPRIEKPTEFARKARRYLSAPFIVSDASEQRLERTIVRTAGGLVGAGVVVIALSTLAFQTIT